MKSTVNKIGIFITCILFYLISVKPLTAQFSDSFTVYYTKTTNLHKNLGNEPWMENIKKVVPKYSKEKYILRGKNGISHYYPLPKEEGEAQIPVWISNGSTNEVIMQGDSFTLRKEVYELKVRVRDSVIPFKWKITNDKRSIAGYNCRKAIARFQDTVMIYAFYAEELVGTSGPEVVQSLPGVILGLGIPTYNTTWFADKVELNAAGFSPVLKPVKKEKEYNRESFRTELKIIFKGGWDNRIEKMYWKLFF
ncbi:MAG: GLPGLI family protein [Sphingomonadales bacterium]|jgi:GLPGLI family protein